MSSVNLETIGLALYGPAWKSAMAEDLNVDPRRITHWLQGTRPVPEGVWHDLLKIARRRLAKITEITEGSTMKFLFDGKEYTTTGRAEVMATFGEQQVGQYEYETLADIVCNAIDSDGTRVHAIWRSLIVTQGKKDARDAYLLPYMMKAPTKIVDGFCGIEQYQQLRESNF